MKQFIIMFFKKTGKISKLKITLLAEREEMKAYSNMRNWRVVEKLLHDVQATKKAIKRIKSL